MLMDTNGNTKELIKDLCSRLPYGVILKTDNVFPQKLEGVSFDKDTFLVWVSDGGFTLDCMDCKPYLLPLSSITEEQKSYINGRWGVNEHFEFEIDPLWGEYFVDIRNAVDFINWCYENHFDINGLIPRGLAEDATDKNIY